MRKWLLGIAASLAAMTLTAAEAPADKTTVVIVAGAAGEEEFGRNFTQWAGAWEKAAGTAGARKVLIGLGATNSTGTDLERLQNTLAAEAPTGAAELWLVFIGHGTFDGKEAKFNLRGPDISATQLAEWLKPIQRPVAIIDTSSSSGPFLNKLSAAGRVIITATRSGFEQNYARFGQFLSEAMVDMKSDLDKDGQVSLLEGYLTASKRVDEFYKFEGRLATEHALLDDNGDGLGTPSDWFRGIRPVKRAKEGAGLDGLRAHQFHLVRSEQEQQLSTTVRAKRDELEMKIAKLRDTKGKYSEEAYYLELEKLLLEISRLYETDSADKKTSFQ
jgi:hypothetical protein